MTKVDTTLRGWSYGELEFEWTTVGPYKVRIIPTLTLMLTLILTQTRAPAPTLTPTLALTKSQTL